MTIRRSSNNLVLTKSSYLVRRSKCCVDFSVYECKECEGVYRVPRYCGLRTCPTCAKRRANKVYRWLKEVVQNLNITRVYRLRLIVLTYGTEGDLRDRVVEVKRAFVKLWRSFLYGKGAGAISCVEVGSKSGSVHLHILYFGAYKRWDKLSKEWKRLTGKWDIDIREVKRESGIKEVVKYVNKGVAGGFGIDELYGIEKAFEGLRRVSTYGVFNGNSRDFVRISKPPFVCPFCGSSKGWWYKGMLELDEEWREGEIVRRLYDISARDPPLIIGDSIG